ncbi:M20/M25/M40 family metallo-hydrolase [Helicobacter sp. 23-1045]
MGEQLQKILEIFYKICEIPHPSGQTQNLAKFIIDFLTKCDCKIQTDSAGNIHAFKGKPHIIFQAHYDMVLVGDKIAPFVENGFLKSRDSSLGADNGIAVALLLHFAKTRTNIEILLTNDEEIGMIGANNITLQAHSKTMINLDSECVNEICVGCAGGFDADISFGAFMRESVPFSSLQDSAMLNRNNPKNPTFYELTAQNFRGGHSGIDIDKNIPNAIVELLWRLESLREMGEFEILEISGGEARNAIPINARAVIATSNSSLTQSLRELEKFSFDRLTALSQSNFSAQPTKQGEAEVSLSNLAQDTRIANDLDNSPLLDSAFYAESKINPSLRGDSIESPKQSTPHIALKKLKNFTPQNPLPSTIIPHLLRLHNGIYEMSAQGVTSSLNFSLISDECLKIMVRANSDEFLHRHKSRLKSLFGENVAFSGFYSAWERESNGDSPILAQLQTLYKKHKIAHKIVQIHAGLECGILKQKCALHEVISIGPTILHPHSKNEALDLDSVWKIYDILCDLIPT